VQHSLAKQSSTRKGKKDLNDDCVCSTRDDLLEDEEQERCNESDEGNEST